MNSKLLFLVLLLSIVAAQEDFMHLMVQSAKENLPRVMESAIKTAKSIPLRKSDAPGLKDRNGKPWVKYVPYDLDRRYDEALFKVYEQRTKLGLKIPKMTVNGQVECVSTPLFGMLLGFAFGLQYNHKTQGKCYTNMEASVIALDNIY